MDIPLNFAWHPASRRAHNPWPNIWTLNGQVCTKYCVAPTPPQTHVHGRGRLDIHQVKYEALGPPIVLVRAVMFERVRTAVYVFFNLGLLRAFVHIGDGLQLESCLLAAVGREMAIRVQDLLQGITFPATLPTSSQPCHHDIQSSSIRTHPKR